MEHVREGRHLAAIMFVDMVGYSALMQDDEPRAIALVRELWDLVRPIVGTHGGREVDLAGDGMLLEFTGALAAAHCALDVLEALHRRNAGHSRDTPLRVRAGLHLGDIEHRDGRIYGDGVNIAARVLALAPAGALAFTGHVRDQLLNVLDEEPQPLGRKALKNIRAPLELWCFPGPDCATADLAAARAAASADAAERLWRFGSAIFDERTLELSVDGRSVDLDKNALDVLLFLLRHAGEVVTKEELLAAAWPGKPPGESDLAARIVGLREALGDEAQQLIKTVHGFGFRFTGAVQVETRAGAHGAQLDFRQGDRIAARPLWSLVRHLGGGGHGEVWLARHEKTREERVFKFALASEHLASLKREITLSRLLHDALAHGSFVQVLDWNLEQAPYFIECEYSRGGSLVDWAAAQGGLERVPLERRLEIAAQIAEALAAAHSIGVLHKDLKPANVLIEIEPLRIKLTDFGSGGVLDTARLAELGITRMGFTKTVLRGESDSGTALYLAPEILAGQPWTSKGDIYALGLMLFQLVVGDLHRTLAPGWERDVPDELLREDIESAAAGNPQQRLGDAATLAERLRTLEPRRARRADETAASARALKQQQALERFRRRRWWTAGLTTTLMLILIFGWFFWWDTMEAYGGPLGMRGLADDMVEAAVARGDFKQARWILSRLTFIQDRRRFHTPIDDALEVDTLMQGAQAESAQGWNSDLKCARALEIAGHSLFYGTAERMQLLRECNDLHARGIRALQKVIEDLQASVGQASPAERPLLERRLNAYRKYLEQTVSAPALKLPE